MASNATSTSKSPTRRSTFDSHHEPSKVARCPTWEMEGSPSSFPNSSPGKTRQNEMLQIVQHKSNTTTSQRSTVGKTKPRLDDSAALNIAADQLLKTTTGGNNHRQPVLNTASPQTRGSDGPSLRAREERDIGRPLRLFRGTIFQQATFVQAPARR